MFEANIARTSRSQDATGRNFRRKQVRDYSARSVPFAVYFQTMEAYVLLLARPLTQCNVPTFCMIGPSAIRDVAIDATRALHTVDRSVLAWSARHVRYTTAVADSAP